jgi:phosphatidylglycerol:prolipoprotein diacylglycerol transferase
MRPRVVEYLAEKIGTGIFVPDYAFMLSLAILVGIYSVMMHAEKAGLDVKRVFRTCLIAVGFALISARLYFVIQHPDYYLRQPLEIFQLWKGGMASFGALTGGVIAALAAAKYQKLSAARFLDCCAPYAALAITFGRIGCFLNGCCYGKISNLPWALRFPGGSGPHHAHLHEGLIASQGLSLPVHPTQLYEAIYGLILFFILLRYRKRQKHDGELVALLFILYPLGRFLNEFLREDDRGFVYFLSVPQVFCAVAVILSVSFLVMKYRVSQAAG